jgi:hypothetical protein
MPDPAFLITVDTEGDNLWAKPRAVTTKNAANLPRFQTLCEKYGLKPTWLTNWEMAASPALVDFARDVLSREAGEVGMHLHAWNSPPIVPLTADDDENAPYLIEYPEPVIREKVKVMTARLEDTFAVKMLSHRAGRWSFDEVYARILVEQGYTVDCSVTPLVSWRFCKGDPSKAGGTDYSRFPDSPYYVDLNDIGRSGDSPLLELPLTVLRTRSWPGAVEALRGQLAGSFYGTILLKKLFPYYHMLMPNGRNREAMLNIVRAAQSQNRPYIEMALHSSELMPGGSPTFATEKSIEKLYEDLESVFAAAKPHFTGATLKEFRNTWGG